MPDNLPDFMKPKVQIDESLLKYNPSDYPEWQRWKGEGDPPAKWEAIDPVTKEICIVYRSYSDYCDD